jgi:NAD(P)-dependent dehydrogenase (short-subunit alcohol dehydrogenase family)
MSSDAQTVLVTGGSRGIGRGIVQAFLTQGARVALMDLKPLPRS